MQILPPLWPFLILTFAIFFGSAPLAIAGDTDPKAPITILDSPELLELLENLGKPLVKAAGLPGESVQFHVILNSQVNAMALPNGNLVFNSALVERCESPEELASVMAHEIAHLAAGHHMRLQNEMKAVSIESLVATVAGLAAGIAANNSSISQAAMIGSPAAAQSMMLDSMREKESQADQLAIHYLAKSGFDPNSMVHFLKHLLAEQRNVSIPAPYLLTHPLSTERVIDAERSASAVIPVKSAHPNTDPIALERVQAIILAATETDPRKAEQRFQTHLKGNPNDIPARYGLTLVLRYSGETKKAHTLIDALLTQQPHDPFFLREKGLILLDEGKPGEAEQVFTQALAQRPNNADLHYRLAVSYTEGGKLEQAARILRKLTVEKPTQPLYQYQLGVVEGQRQRLGHAHLAMARYYALLMDEKMAVFHYDEATNNFPQSEREHEIAQSELKRFKEEHRKSRLK
ncbi:MAG: M48 family metalloprotease [Magnetococcus sp. THC-1_WYH]